MSERPSLAGRVALVTGGAGALGRAVSGRLLADGAQVAVPLETAADEQHLRPRLSADAAGRLFTSVVDVTDLDAMSRFVADTVGGHGRIDILVSLVGGFAGGALVDTGRATWDRMLALNVTSTFVATRAVVPHMVKAGRGRIVTIGSRAVVPPGPGFIAYTTAKAAVIAFTQALAQEVKSHGITVNAVLPSTMDTPANRAAMPDVDPRTWIPVTGVADVIAFLVGDGAAHVTGALLSV